jgi:hypothetical protein
MIGEGPVTVVTPPAASVSSDRDEARNEPLLRDLWRFWKAYAARAAGYQSVILLTLVYYLVFGPSALAARLTGKQLLPMAARDARSYWRERPAAEPRLSALERQF